MAQISVIVPVYNTEPYIDRCIGSILNQTYNDYEFLLIDDGSVDDSGLNCDKHLLKDHRLITIHMKNKGVSVARNICTEMAAGAYVAYIDSDDWIDNNMLSEMYNAAKLSQADVAICGYRNIDLDGTIVDEYIPENNIINNIEALEYYIKIDNPIIRSAWNKLVRKGIALTNPFPVGRKYSEDYAVVYKWFFNSERIVSVGMPFYNYFFSEMGICRSNNIPFTENMLTLGEILEFCRDHDLKGLENFIAKKRIRFDTHMFYETNKNEMREIFRNDLRLCLKKYFLKIKFFPFNELEIYATAFPIMRGCCHIVAMFRMLRTKGLLCTLNRLIKGRA